MLPGLLVFLLALLAAGAGTAEAKRYSADRFDSRVEVLPDGSIRVTETVVFRFESGTFREVYRELPQRRTDGLEIERATMDGLDLPRGEEPGQVDVRTRRRVRVTWYFTPRSDVSHTFGLVYLVRGAFRQHEEGDALRWHALPTEHRYRIAASTIDVLLPSPPVAPPAIDSRRVARATTRVDGHRVRVEAEGIRSNGRIALEVLLPRGRVLDGPPAWQAREQRHWDRAPQWLGGGAVALALSLILAFAIRQGYDAPKHDRTVAATGPALPDSFAPAEAGALVTNGCARFEHAMATLLDLARRGEITIVEGVRGSVGQRRYTVTRRPTRRPAAPFEEALLESIFMPSGQAEASVPLDKARSRALGRFKAFRTALEAELRGHGLFDVERKRVRARFAKLGATLLIVAAILPIPLFLLLEEPFGTWPMLVPLGLATGGIVALIAHAAHTPLSNEGLRRARYWRGFLEYLTDVTENEATAPSDSYERLLPYAVALGLASRWSKHLEERRVEVPSWFQASTPGDSSPAFAAFVASGGAAAGDGGGAGMAGGAAGGGASGAR